VRQGGPLPELIVAFHRHFGSPDPAWAVRAPGRVNLIGEHIDYNGLSVLPMALQRHVMLLVRARADREVHVVTTAPGLTPDGFTLDAEIPRSPAGSWVNYVKAAAQALERDHGPLRGFDGLIHSTIPIAAGLSSSAALVIGSALALLAANDRAFDRVALAERMAEAERYTGTKGGGMDQAICLGAELGAASRIDFEPLRLTPVPVPPRWRMVVAHSLIHAEKSGGARERYNRRTVECREALEAVRAHLGMPDASYGALLAARSADDLLAAGERVLRDPIRRRYRHVIGEARRVADAEAALRAADLAGFGVILTASHASLRDDYEVSVPELDRLVSLSEEAGAAGARLTGAGMGGCIVAAADDATGPAVLAHLAERFYAGRSHPQPLSDVAFVAEPSAGASVTPIG
jgi:galactokinase